MQTITKKTLTDTVYSGKTPVLTYTIHYPIFTSDCSEQAAKSINSFYAAISVKMESYCRNSLAEEAKKQADYAGRYQYPFFPYEFISGYTAAYNTGCITSLFFDQYTYAGGAHGSTVRCSDTWDFKLGKRLSLADFYPRDPSYRENILKELERQAKERETKGANTFFEDYPKLLKNSFKPENFFVTPEGIVIYFQQYDIAPYSTGIPEFLLLFEMEDSVKP